MRKLRFRYFCLCVGLTAATLVAGLAAPAQAAPRQRRPWVKQPLSVISCKVAPDYCFYQFDTTYGYGGQTIGTVHWTITLTINGRDINWYMTSDATSGPSIKAEHSWNCVDHGQFINTSCSSGWHNVWHSVYTSGQWTYPNPATYFLSDGGTYWMDFEWHWKATGWGSITWYTGRWTTTHWTCDTQPGTCYFP